MPVTHEHLKHLEAFNYYYSLGDNRTIQAVCDHFGYKKYTVQKWRRIFNWNDRVKERDREIYYRMQEELDDQIYEDKKTYRNLIKASLQTYIQNLKDGKIDVRRVKDFDTLVQLDLSLMGLLDSGSRDDRFSTLKNSMETSQTFSKLMDEIKGIEAPPEEDDSEY